MHGVMKLGTALFLGIGAVSLAVAEHGDLDELERFLPAVPLSVLEGQGVKQDVPAPTEQESLETAQAPVQAPAAERASRSEPVSVPAPSAQADQSRAQALTVTVTPGINEIIPVALNHLNRVVVPFDEPRVLTTSEATTETRGRAIYVATSSLTPVTMYVTAGDDESLALSLTLAPQRIAPVEVNLQIEDGMAVASPVATRQAQRWEMSQPYIETIRDLLRGVALGEVPQGYALSETLGAAAFDSCEQSGLEFDFTTGQLLVGHRLQVHVGTARNTSSDPIEFVESNCADWRVTAVAAWPENLLYPGERTEIYVVRQRQNEAEVRPTRRSLLEGNPL